MSRTADRSERDPEAVELGARLRQVRELNGLSQRELARRAGVTNSNISLIEQGQISPSVGSLARLLDAFPLSLAQFFALDPKAPEGGIVRAGSAARTECPDMGLTIESLPVPGGRPRLLERCQFAPGADTGSAPKQLPAARAGWVISGSLELTLGVRCYTLNEGDGFHLPKGQLFRARNTSSVSTIVMITNEAS
ncbi:helix-turn-helix domain-containing protein [Marinimicrobium agarilyticum]|uniref:helix-turn-helix domain-containing protein n=1 Tax=Marinimicrobium agarilyticum TaxID=306546 RepID=UPI00040780E9|nr:helix-turn-helix domain-containing protein [Marinimicrobium agarilyticum]